jgi:D-3-phosphoglycerate dehydrogenase
MDSTGYSAARPARFSGCRIVVTMPSVPTQVQALLSRHAVFYIDAARTDGAGLRDFIQRHDPHGILVRMGKIDGPVIDAAPSLRVISKHGSGVDSIDSERARARGIAVHSTPGANAIAVAEHTLSLLLACSKSLVDLNLGMQSGHWGKATHQSIQLAGKTLGVIGLGAIGMRFARMAHALGMHVIGHSHQRRALPRYMEWVARKEMWPRADAISLHCPLTPDTRQMVNAEALQCCKRGVILINTARGGLIDDQALVTALHSGQVGAAGLDTYTREPAGSDNIYRGAPNTILTPHVGAATPEAFERTAILAARNLLQGLAGSARGR